MSYLGFCPPGVVLPYAGSVAPDGWLLCDGSAISRNTYAGLWQAISTTYGSGDGSLTFNLPDLRGRAVAGKDNMGGAAANRLENVVVGVNLGATGGAEKHALSIAQVPSHGHTQQGSFSSGGHSADHAHYTTTGGISANHTHSYWEPVAGGRVQGGLDNYVAHGVAASPSNTGTVSSDHVHGGWSGGVNTNHSHSTSISGQTASVGSGSGHDNIQPTIVLNYIIKI